MILSLVCDLFDETGSLQKFDILLLQGDNVPHAAHFHKRVGRRSIGSPFHPERLLVTPDFTPQDFRLIHRFGEGPVEGFTVLFVTSHLSL